MRTAVAATVTGSAAEGTPEEAPPNHLEMRAARSDGAYRYLGYSRAFSNGIVADILYIGVPGQNELYAGLGYEFQAGREVFFTPILYAVAGREDGQLGVALGAFVEGRAGPTGVYAFLGYFHPLRGDVSRYAFLDSLDVTWMAGSWEFGPSVGVFGTDVPPVDEELGLQPEDHVGTEWTWLAGPVVVKHDDRGAWKAYVRGGSHLEVRIARTFGF